VNPYTVVHEFEKRVAEWCGSEYAVAVESGTAAIFLSLMYVKEFQNDDYLGLRTVVIPSKTYPSVPCSIIHAGGNVAFTYTSWEGEYQLYPYPIWDAALRFKKGMYHGGLQCLSFHIKKHLQIGRGGMVLTDSEAAYEWLKKARFDGREPIPLSEDNFTMLGWNMYLEPANAARGIQLFEVMKQKYPDGMEDLIVEEQGYPDLSKFPIYQK
jgi:dTDP-4-amino-4,6-dideoxygalactose transaminase